MTGEQNGKIEARIKKVTEDFDTIEKEKQGLVEQRNKLVNSVSTIDRRLSEIQASQISLHGRHDELQALLPEKKKVPELVIPKEESKKKKTKEN